MIQRLEEALDCDTLGEAADRHLRERVKRYRQSEGRFRGWLETTLTRMVWDEMRKRRRRGNYSIEDPNQVPAKNPDDEPTPSVHDRLTTALNALRTTLDELESRPRARQQKTDYHAVLLIELRLALSARLRGHRQTLQAAGESRSTLAARRIPWTDSESLREVQPGWPTLKDIWTLLSAELDRSDELFTDDDLVRLVSRQPGVIGLTAVAWRQWRTRSSQAAEEFLSHERWTGTVALWL